MSCLKWRSVEWEFVHLRLRHVYLWPLWLWPFFEFDFPAQGLAFILSRRRNFFHRCWRLNETNIILASLVSNAVSLSVWRSRQETKQWCCFTLDPPAIYLHMVSWWVRRQPVRSTATLLEHICKKSLKWRFVGWECVYLRLCSVYLCRLWH